MEFLLSSSKRRPRHNVNSSRWITSSSRIVFASIVTLFLLISSMYVVIADEAAAADDANAAAADDFYNSGDDGNLQAWDGSDDQFDQTSSGEIKYWTDYAIYPKRCIR